MKAMLSAFAVPTIISALVLLGIAGWLGFTAFVTAALLVVLEVTLSFDNAVVNAKVLAKMTAKWQQRFLTWGIWIAVFLTRALFPIIIVAVSVALSPLEVTKLALFEPAHYAELLEGAKTVIYAFGGIFLFMVGLKYFFDDRKDMHWLHWIEKHLARWGSVEAVEIAISLVTILLLAWFLPAYAMQIFFAGIVAIVLFILVQGIASAFSVETSGTVAGVGFALFMYLNILDAAFSLDSVIGAFALSTQLPVIVAGLGIGAYFVRALTVYMVRQKTLAQLIYIEHGAHWAILGLAIAMLASMFVEVPEPFTGLIGLGFLMFAYISSLRRAAA